jgi:hypothetical protein
VTGAGTLLVMRLAAVKVSGLPARMLRGVLLKTIRDMAAGEPGVAVDEETIRIDLARHTGAQRVRLRLNLTAVRCAAGELMIEAGPLVV